MFRHFRKNMLHKYYSLLAVLLISALVFSCFKESVLPIKADFTIEYELDNKAAPVKIKLKNISEGAESYYWTFEGANLKNSTERTPTELIFEKNGTYKIKLEVKNLDGQSDVKEVQVIVGESIKASFSYSIEVNNFAPAKVNFKNSSKGATRYEWTFVGAEPASSSDENPIVTFNKEGTYALSLKAYNGNAFVKYDSTIKIGPALSPDFEYSVLDFNVNFEAPLQLKAKSISKGAVSYEWSIDDSKAKISIQKDSSIILNLPEAKKYTLTLTAFNGKTSAKVAKVIEAQTNKNILFWQDVKLGINDNSSIPNYFSSRRNVAVGKKTLDTLSFGNEVDIVFFARDTSFSYCRFVSPDKVSSLLMSNIPNASKTEYLNLDCKGCTSISDNVFENIKKADDISTLKLYFGENVVEGFGRQTKAKYVPFKTEDNRLGIIKIKKFTSQGINSFITTDIKVFRKP